MRAALSGNVIIFPEAGCILCAAGSEYKGPQSNGSNTTKSYVFYYLGLRNLFCLVELGPFIYAFLHECRQKIEQ